MISKDRLLLSLFKKSPYEDFDKTGFIEDIPIYNSNSDVFEKLINEIKPELIIELGSLLGGSAITMSKILKKQNYDCKIFCVDTWLGALEFYELVGVGSKKNDMLRLKNGYPQMYYQFLFNIINNEFQDIVIPFPNTTQIAARWFKKYTIKADLIYVDASHDEKDVYDDMGAYWDILSDNGIMFGDDWNWTFGQGLLKNAVIRFCQEKELDYELYNNNFWIIRKKVN